MVKIQEGLKEEDDGRKWLGGLQKKQANNRVNKVRESN